MEVRYFKLTNGDEVIAKIVEETELSYQVNHPFVLRYSNMAGTTTVMMFPWVISPTIMKCEFKFLKANIIAESIAPESFHSAHAAAVQALDRLMEPQPFNPNQLLSDEETSDDVSDNQDEEEDKVEIDPAVQEELFRIFKGRLN